MPPWWRMSLGGLLPLSSTPPWYFTNVTRQWRDGLWSLCCSQRVMSLPGMIQPASNSATAVGSIWAVAVHIVTVHTSGYSCVMLNRSSDISESPPPAVISNSQSAVCIFSVEYSASGWLFLQRNLTLEVLSCPNKASHLNTLQAISPFLRYSLYK